MNLTGFVRKALVAFGLAALGVTALFWAGVFALLLMRHGNHVGVEILWMEPVFLAMALAGVALWRQNRRLAVILICAGVCAALGVFLLDRLNIVVEYNKWIKRGMP